MHVLLIPSWYPTDLNPVNGIFFKEQAKALHRSGVKVGVIAPIQRSILTLKDGRIFDYFYKLDYRVEDEIPTYRLLGWSIPKVYKLNLKVLYYYIPKLIKSYIQNLGKPDIVHAHSALWGGEIALCISKILKIPYVITEHSSAYARGLIKPWQETYLKRIFENASLVIGVSSKLLENISQYYTHKNSEVVPNVVDTDYFTLPPTRRKKCPFEFLSVALLTPIKGMEILIKAFYEAFREVDDVVLKIGGDGPSRPLLEKLVEELKMKERVKFLGMLDRYQVRENMWKANVFVLPSYYETFGVVLIEAMSTGLPVIATKCGGPEDFVNPMVGSLVEKGNVLELAEEMIKWYRRIKNSIDWNYEKDIREYAVSNFSYEAVAKRLVYLYNLII